MNSIILPLLTVGLVKASALAHRTGTKRTMKTNVKYLYIYVYSYAENINNISMMKKYRKYCNYHQNIAF